MTDFCVREWKVASVDPLIDPTFFNFQTLDQFRKCEQFFECYRAFSHSGCNFEIECLSIATILLGLKVHLFQNEGFRGCQNLIQN